MPINPRIRPEPFRLRRRHLVMTVGAVATGVAIARFPGRTTDAALPGTPHADRVVVDRQAQESHPADAVASATIAASSPIADAVRQPVSAFSIPLSFTVPSTMLVGDMGDLVISTRTAHRIRSISLRMRVDPNVLAVQEGSAGDWLARSASPTPFLSQVSPQQDQIWLRSDAGEAVPESESGSVAIVRLQAMAPGDATVTIDEVQVIDDSGAAVRFTCSPSQVVVKVANPIPG